VLLLRWPGLTPFLQGAIEVADQIEGVEYLIATDRYSIDRERIAIHGWSYGMWFARYLLNVTVVLILRRTNSVSQCAAVRGTLRPCRQLPCRDTSTQCGWWMQEGIYRCWESPSGPTFSRCVVHYHACTCDPCFSCLNTRDRAARRRTIRQLDFTVIFWTLPAIDTLPSNT